MEEEDSGVRKGKIMTTRKRYLGDGVYAEWDGWVLKLETKRQHNTDEIYLSLEELDVLFRFLGIEVRPKQPEGSSNG